MAGHGGLCDRRASGGEVICAGHVNGLHSLQYQHLTLSVRGLVAMRPVLDVAVEALQEGPALRLRAAGLATKSTRVSAIAGTLSRGAMADLVGAIRGGLPR
jgi:hypothetical protein